MGNNKTICVIVPCYNEANVLSLYKKELDRISKLFVNVKLNYIFVNDGSSDNTLDEIKKIAANDSNVHYISFSRNFGKESAMYSGLVNSKGDYTVIMDADLQHQPKLLLEMFDACENEGFDSAAARRLNRAGESFVKSFFSKKFYWLFQIMCQTDIVDGATDYRMMNKKFVDALLSMSETNRFSKGMFGWVGFKTKWIEFENVERVAGETKWSLFKLFKYSLEGIIGFSTFPLVLSSLLGIFFCSIAVLSLIVLIIRKFINPNLPDGWTTLLVVILFIGGLQFLCLGILGQYLAKTYLETKKRPIYIISESKL